jgi:hypothetical protein
MGLIRLAWVNEKIDTIFGSQARAGVAKIDAFCGF